MYEKDEYKGATLHSSNIMSGPFTMCMSEYDLKALYFYARHAYLLLLKAHL